MDGFDSISPRTWGLNAVLLELFTEIGSLGRAITIKEHYRHGKVSKHKLADEFSDIFFVLLKLARSLFIRISGKIKAKKIDSPEKSFIDLACEAAEVSLIVEADQFLSQSFVVKKKIEEMISVILGLSLYYKIFFAVAHSEEMKLASFWQKIFFDKKGRKIKNSFILPFIKIRWYFIVKKHERKLNNM